MAKSTEKRSQISATIPASLKEALEEYRWGVRMNLSELVEAALTEFARDNVEGFVNDDTPDEDDTPAVSNRR